MIELREIRNGCVKFDDLQFVRVIDPNSFRKIARRFFEQVNNYDFEIDKLKKIRDNDSNKSTDTSICSHGQHQ